MIKGMNYLNNNLKDIDTPFLLFHGGVDKIVGLEGSIKLFEESKSLDKTFYY